MGSLAIGQWALTDLAHVPGGGIGILAIGAGMFWLSSPLKSRFDAPKSVQGWIRRCQNVLEQFEALDDENHKSQELNKRIKSLNSILDRESPQKLAFVCTTGSILPDKELIQSAISCEQSLSLSWTSSLPLKGKSWIWPKSLFDQDCLVYILSLPLRASDLLWLEQIPQDQPSWVMVSDKSSDWAEQLTELKAQLPERWNNRILPWNDSHQDLGNLLHPVRNFLKQPKKNIDNTKQRQLERLHCSWQADLEQLRRNKFKVIQQRTQWAVAGAVFASPVPSTDLLALSVANGLMIKEMAKIWSCSWDSESLQVIAKQLAGVAIAQGVVEWSGHAILSVAKLHGSSWLAAGTMQALSAAYLTRVVGRSMADWLALNNGVSEPDLEALKREAPQLIERASKEERLNWNTFLKQATNWIDDSSKDPKINTTFIEAL